MAHLGFAFRVWRARWIGFMGSGLHVDTLSSSWPKPLILNLEDHPATSTKFTPSY